MKIKLSPSQKGLLVILFLILTIIGFMIKLPVPFRKIDREMHALFYFIAAAFLNILFAGRSLFRHILIFVLLYLFSMGIEWAQEYSNRFFRSRIHGRFDPVDIRWNLRGLLAFSALWILYVLATLGWRKKEIQTEPDRNM